jgi:hypothetical protein
MYIKTCLEPSSALQTAEMRPFKESETTLQMAPSLQALGGDFYRPECHGGVDWSHNGRRPRSQGL